MPQSNRVVERYLVATKKPLHVVEGEDGMEARVWLNSDGKRFNVTLFDTDSGETATQGKIFDDEKKAVAYAKTLAR